MSASEQLLQVAATGFDEWRETARRLLAIGAAPETIQWLDGRAAKKSGERELPGLAKAGPSSRSSRHGNAAVDPPVFSVPKTLVELLKKLSHHRDARRWGLMYRLLWRVTGGECHLLQIDADADVYLAHRMQKSIDRDVHKLHAFVRFVETQDDNGSLYVAWHQPDHYIVPLAAPFFARRFDVMRWALLTPEESAYWDGTSLSFGPGCSRSEAPRGDAMQELWKTYYASIFNPARVNLGAMRAEMPLKHWRTLPETELIDQLVRKAPGRVEKMIRNSEGPGQGAAAFLPADRSIDALRVAARDCRGCMLCETAVQTVFGEGPSNARVMIVGEQPGDNEDLQGRPFVGPAGQLLRETMDAVGLDPTSVYITNAVKHFKWKPSGKRRLHQKPSSREISACRPWLNAEVEAIRPAMIICLGATAATTVLGPAFRLTKQRGQIFRSDACRWTMATYHPSALLRVPDAESRERMQQIFTDDLRSAVELLATLPE